MKALITGGRGQLARALRAAAPDGWQVVAPTRQELDICDPVAIGRALQGAPDLVINAAAYTAVDRAESEPDAAGRVNAEAVAALADACRERTIRLVHYSTDFIFDGRSGSPYRPGDVPAPLGVYGRTKLTGEQAAAGVLDNLVIRTAWVYGAGGSNFVATVLRLLRERDELRIVADQVGTPTHAASLARATWQLAGQDARGVLHFTDAGVASWYDFAVAIQEEALAAGLTERTVPIVPIATADYPTPARRPAYSVLDKAETWDRLGGPARHWRAELRAMLAQLHESSNG